MERLDDCIARLEQSCEWKMAGDRGLFPSQEYIMIGWVDSSERNMFSQIMSGILKKGESRFAQGKRYVYYVYGKYAYWSKGLPDTKIICRIPKNDLPPKMDYLTAYNVFLNEYVRNYEAKCQAVKEIFDIGAPKSLQALTCDVDIDMLAVLEIVRNLYSKGEKRTGQTKSTASLAGHVSELPPQFNEMVNRNDGEVLAMYKEWKSMADIAKRLNKSEAVVFCQLYELLDVHAMEIMYADARKTALRRRARTDDTRTQQLKANVVETQYKPQPEPIRALPITGEEMGWMCWIVDSLHWHPSKFEENTEFAYLETGDIAQEDLELLKKIINRCCHAVKDNGYYKYKFTLMDRPYWVFRNFRTMHRFRLSPEGKE